MKREQAIRVIGPGDLAPGTAIPYLPAAWEWQIRQTPFDLLDEEEARLAQEGLVPTLRLVKDEKVVDVHVPGMSTTAFLAHWGLHASMAKGGYLLSKRLSRLLQAYRWWGFFAPGEVKVVHRAEWDGALWDGAGRVSRRFLHRALLPRLAALPDPVRERLARELRDTERFEVTVMHAGGQEKGDVLVCDRLPDRADFAFPAGSAKAELAQAGQLFVGLLAARHAQAGMQLDPQSLINLHPFLDPGQLLQWLGAEGALFLEGLATGRAGGALRRMVEAAPDAAALDRLADWPTAEFVASGGDLRWFAGVTRAVGRQHLARLEERVAGKLRLPAPGGRFYLFPASVGGRAVPPGQVELDPATATAWVADEDWLGYLVRVLGGCDGDDAAWVLPFLDEADGARKVLLWRSPNQVGEWVLLRPTATSHELRWELAGGKVLTWPRLDSRRLPPRVDTVAYEYAALQEAPGGPAAGAGDGYTVAGMCPTIQLARANQGTLGRYCNIQMVLKALDGELPRQLPASLETVIDGSVKRFVDLDPVRVWIQAQAAAIACAGVPVPEALRGRLVGLLERGERRRVARSQGEHWLDDLLRGIRAHQVAYAAAVDELAARAMPPAALFEAVDPSHEAAGRALRAGYAAALRRGEGPAGARRVTERLLAELPTEAHGGVLLAAAAACYGMQVEAEAACRDGVLWQLGEKRPTGQRAPGVAHAFLAALREAHLLGDPCWTGEGGVVVWDVATPADLTPGVALLIRGTWHAWLRAAWPLTPASMSAVPRADRDRAKARVAERAASCWRGLVLTPIPSGERLAVRVPTGHLFGWVPRGQEGLLAGASAWRIAWAHATDGNVHALLVPER